MNLQQIKEKINLREYARKYHGLVCNSRGMAKCPFHPPDKNPSFAINFDDGVWKWRDPHDQSGGCIPEFEAKFANCSISQAKKNLLKRFGDKENNSNIEESSTKTATVNNCNIPAESTIRYIYRNEDGKAVFLKEKKILINGEKNYFWFHEKNGQWIKTMGGLEHIPYNLHEFKNHERLIIAEGEKDADTINNLEMGEFATSGSTGADDWQLSLTQYFKGKKEIIFLYDIGAEKAVKKHALELKETYPEMKIFIASIPMKEKNADITDYLDRFKTKKEKQLALADILSTYEEFTFKGIYIGNFENLMIASIPEDEKLVDPIVFRGGLTEIGGVKGSHKSFFLNLLSLHYASGLSPFLKFNIEKPGKILLIQQEVSLGFNQKRLKKMAMSGAFFTEGRFFPITTTASRLKLLTNKDLDRIKRWLDQYQPDALGLDPLASFHVGEENMARDMLKIVNVLSELKSIYNIAVIFTHHFSSKINPGNPNAPIEAGGWFRGHTTLTDAADVLVCLHRLPGQRENPNLPKTYEDYNLVQIELRNGKWPERFAIEFDEETFLLKESDIWQEIGKKILPNQIEELLEANEGKMLQRDIINYFKSTASPTTTKKAIREAIYQKLIIKEILSEKGNPALLRIKKGDFV